MERKTNPPLGLIIHPMITVVDTLSLHIFRKCIASFFHLPPSLPSFLAMKSLKKTIWYLFVRLFKEQTKLPGNLCNKQ